MSKTLITNEQVAAARALAEAIQAALAKLEAGAAGEELPELPEVTVTITPSVAPSADVASAVADAERARDAFAAETDARRAMAVILTVGAEVGKALLPFAAALL
ncbi:MAG: hypothetical protein WC789_13840 [Lentisphaeria bacterium]